MRDYLKKMLPKIKVAQLGGLVLYELSIASERHESVMQYFAAIEKAASIRKQREPRRFKNLIPVIFTGAQDCMGSPKS
jgi:hypothetical protein